ncbi:MAG: hypothetical protein IPP40_06555 [bacterium]|nr:hypothetical protein [bacterium]
MFPPIPAWEGLHPLIIHFPIALLITAPVLVIAGILFSNQRQGLFIAAFALMLVGSIASFVAVSTGEAAGELAERNDAVNVVIEEHEELAELTRTLFALLTIVFGAILFGPKLLKKELAPGVLSIVMVAFLLFYSGGVLVLANTAHQGGRLVHEFGVRAMMQTAAASIPSGSVSHSNDQQAADDDND